MLFRKIVVSAAAVFAAAALFAADAANAASSKPLVVFQVKNTMDFMQKAQKYAMDINPNLASMIPMYGTALMMNPQAQGIDFTKPVTVMSFEPGKSPVIVAAGSSVQPQNITLPGFAAPLTPSKTGNNLVYAADDAMRSAGVKSAGLVSSVPGNGIALFFPDSGRIAEYMLADAQKKMVPGNAQQAQTVEGLKLFKEYMSNFSNFGFGLSFEGDRDLVLTFGATAIPGTDVSKYLHAKIPVPTSPLPVLDNAVFYMSTTSPNTPELYDYSRKAVRLNAPQDPWVDELYKEGNFTGIFAGSGSVDEQSGEAVLMFAAEVSPSAVKNVSRILENNLTKLPQGFYSLPLPKNGEMDNVNFFVKMTDKCVLYVLTTADAPAVEKALKTLKPYTVKNAPGEYTSIYAKVSGNSMTKIGSVSAKGDVVKFDIHFTTDVVKKILESVPAPQPNAGQPNAGQTNQEFVPEDFN